jgi:hypothetical protein
MALTTSYGPMRVPGTSAMSGGADILAGVAVSQGQTQRPCTYDARKLHVHRPQKLLRDYTVEPVYDVCRDFAGRLTAAHSGRGLRLRCPCRHSYARSNTSRSHQVRRARSNGAPHVGHLAGVSESDFTHRPAARIRLVRSMVAQRRPPGHPGLVARAGDELSVSTPPSQAVDLAWWGTPW